MNKSLLLSLLFLIPLPIVAMEEINSKGKNRETEKAVKQTEIKQAKSALESYWVTLVSEDKQNFTVISDVVRQSITLKDMLDDIKNSDKHEDSDIELAKEKKTEIEINIPNIKGDTLFLIVKLLIKMHEKIQEQEYEINQLGFLKNTKTLIKFEGTKTKSIFITENVLKLIMETIKNDIVINELTLEKLSTIVLACNYLDIEWLTNAAIKLWVDKYLENRKSLDLPNLDSEEFINILLDETSFPKDLYKIFTKHFNNNRNGTTFERTIASYIAMHGWPLKINTGNLGEKYDLNFENAQITSLDDLPETDFTNILPIINNNLSLNNNYITEFPKDFFNNFTNLSGTLNISGNPIKTLPENSFENLIQLNKINVIKIPLLAKKVSTENFKSIYFPDRKNQIIVELENMDYPPVPQKKPIHSNDFCSIQ